MKPDFTVPAVVVCCFLGVGLRSYFQSISFFDAVLFVIASGSVIFIIGSFIWVHWSKSARDRKKRAKFVAELPMCLKVPGPNGVHMGKEFDLGIQLYLPDSIRARHLHLLGGTGSGKTESVILNFLRQDVTRGLGAIVLDAKGDDSFLIALNQWVPQARLQVFDLSTAESLGYNALAIGHPLESAQRLFASLTWSEEYYRSKAFSALQRLFQAHHEKQNKNPTLKKLAEYLNDKETYSAFVASNTYTSKVAELDFNDLGGLRDQINILCTGHLEKILSPTDGQQMDLESAAKGQVLYFRLQSLLSPEVVSIVGRLIINHLNYLAGTAHRSTSHNHIRTMIPVYLDEFASFACPEFADLISKARSANLALHFSHQSIGDLAEEAKGFLNRITDNSATKIVMRISDPETADFFSRSFGTQLYQKVTQRVTNAKDLDRAEIMGEGSQREAHQFRASPDLLKRHPTGFASVLIAHGENTPHGGSSVFKIQFPKLKEETIL